MLVVVAACAGAPRAPARPSPATVRAIEAAEDAERVRDHATARARYLAAIASAPDAASERFARRELADTLLAWGEIDAGRVQLEAVLALAPEDAAAWHDLGLVRHNLGDDRGAIAALARSRDLAATDPRPRIALAVLYWKLGDLPHARAEYVELARLGLPDRLRVRVEWAIACLSAPREHAPAGCPQVRPAPPR